MAIEKITSMRKKLQLFSYSHVSSTILGSVTAIITDDEIQSYIHFENA